MLTFIFIVLMLGVFGKMLGFAIKCTWSILKIVLYLVIAPIVIIAMFFSGLVYVAFIALIIMGVVSLVKAIV